MDYVGNELAIFQHAKNWKSYVKNEIAPYVRGDVLEVGAGLGATTCAFESLEYNTWTCVEPDPRLFAQLQSALPNHGKHTAVSGTLSDLPQSQLFDAVLYIDVLEHIEDHAAELRRARKHLRKGGSIIVLSPAHQWLFSPFDAEIGHFRRYSIRTLREVGPDGAQLERIWYLDSAGMLASAANHTLLKQSMPTQRQILTWDRMLVPVSRVLDPLTRWRIGKSIVAVWRA